MEFTPEQQRIVDHGDGHALVFAVAGSGKTTTLVGRIRQLVRKQEVRPVRILATTFTREARRSLEEKLAQYPECTGVAVLTLHALATRIVDRARDMGFTELVIGEEHFSHRLFNEARKLLLAELDEADRDFAAQLRQLAFKDFETYLGIQKGNLRLPYMPAALPEAAAALITPPDAGPDVYARLYAKHDELRRREGKLDYDDLIVAAWMLMSRFPALHDDITSRWDYVNIDEFQDVNLAQSEMMHLVALRARSFMAIGDDDQTIYQWRGAHPRFILGFAGRYGAQEYTLPSNFRCPLGVIALADKVIAENKVRAPKRLRATRGGSGVHLHSPRAGEAARVAIKAISEGHSPEEVVVLLRTYAQSAEIEQVFLQEKVPYRLVGAVPFYRRAEVTTLTAYLELALADLDLMNGEELSTSRREKVQKLWRTVANRPSRYLKTADVEAIARQAWRGERTLASVLESYSADQPEHVRKPLTLLATWLDFLSEDMGTTPGKDVLLDFVSAIGYREYLIASAPTQEFGEERAGSIDALAEMAQTRSLGALITHLAELHEQVRYEEQLQRRGNQDVPRVTLMTAFRAKGLEWPVVIIPDCIAGIFGNKPSADAAASEEERRVFYVAMTRAQKELHLITGDDDDTTDFLKQVAYESVVGQHHRLAGLLQRDPGTWTAVDTLEAAQLLGRYEHEAFVQRWVDRTYRARLLGRFTALQGQLARQGRDDVRQAAGRALDLTRYAQHGPVDHLAPEMEKAFPDLAAVCEILTQPTAPASARSSAVKKEPGVDALGRTAAKSVDLKVGDRVRHRKLGEGEVLQVSQVAGQPEALIRFTAETKRVSLNFTRLDLI
ncbi:ATP-dependent helicase [Deinococcus malanensis]|nr:ATP-dependent helicase [Deinococcus malanensis]